MLVYKSRLWQESLTFVTNSIHSMNKGILLLFALLMTSIKVLSVEVLSVEAVDSTETYNRTDSTSMVDFTSTESISWINLGLGTSLQYPLAFNIGLNYQLKKYSISARFLIADEIDLQKQSSSESIWDAGILLGRMCHNDIGLLSFAAGLSFVGGLKRGAYIANDETWGGYYKMEHRATVGIPLESHLIYLLSKNAGIGITAFGNLNFDKPFFGALLSLQLGILR